jgi:hypothetical protein
MSRVLETLEGIRHELRLIRRTLEMIEDSVGEKMTKDDEKALEAALEEHSRGETISLEDARKLP